MLLKESWLLIEGNDSIGNRRLAGAIAESVFGSADLLFYMNMRNRESRMSPRSESLERTVMVSDSGACGGGDLGWYGRGGSNYRNPRPPPSVAASGLSNGWYGNRQGV
uniref:Uncharacterized protein n=1 Tax=Davidia involucrata TaxID=16924 RepID=A0A5B7C8N2_DAVIN